MIGDASAETTSCCGGGGGGGGVPGSALGFRKPIDLVRQECNFGKGLRALSGFIFLWVKGIIVKNNKN